MVTIIIESISVGAYSDKIRRSRTRLGLLKNEDNLLASLDIFIYNWKKLGQSWKLSEPQLPSLIAFLA